MFRTITTTLLTLSLLCSLIPSTIFADTTVTTPVPTEKPLSAAFTTTANCTNSTLLRGVPTYESLGLYLNVGAGEAKVRYRQQGQTSWKEGFSLSYDARNDTEVLQNNSGARQRGSLVHLTPNTPYEVQVLHGNTLYCGTFSTLSDNFPIAQTVQIGTKSSTYRINQGGTASGYVLYTGGTINTNDSVGLVIDADYVIVRGVTVTGPQGHGIVVSRGHHHVVIENSTVTNWGRYTNDALCDGSTYCRFWGDADFGVYLEDDTYRITIQKNHIHTPRTDANTWGEMIRTRYNCLPTDRRCHPLGPRGIGSNMAGTMTNGQNVVRYNSIIGTPTHMFEDGFNGRNADRTQISFPGPDSDLYGNFVTGFTDDALELEGNNRNTRVWNNHIDVIKPDGSGDQASTGSIFGLSPISIGPMYIWRNLTTTADNSRKVASVKKQTRESNLAGRLYFLHNTMRASGNIGSSNTQVYGIYAYNNVLDGGGFEGGGIDFAYDYNLYTGSSPAQPHGLRTTPQFGSNGILRTGTAGVNQGTYIPNFSDNYAGSAPDMGYQEAGGAALRVGHTGSPLIVTGGGTGATGTTIGGTTGATGTTAGQLPPPDPTTPCGDYQNPTTPTGYGSAYNHFSTTKEKIVSAACASTGFTPIIGSSNTTDANFAVYNQGYYWTGTRWQSYTYTPTPGGGRASTQNPGWILGDATTTRIPYQGATTYFVAYTCHFGTTSSPKCGCSDSTCATPKWQLQGVTRVAQ